MRSKSLRDARRAGEKITHSHPNERQRQATKIAMLREHGVDASTHFTLEQRHVSCEDCIEAMYLNVFPKRRGVLQRLKQKRETYVSLRFVHPTFRQSQIRLRQSLRDHHFRRAAVPSIGLHDSRTVLAPLALVDHARYATLFYESRILSGKYIKYKWLNKGFQDTSNAE